MDVSIIIVNYNSFRLILSSIESVYKHTIGINFEIIVVDNDSPQRDIERIHEHYSEVIFLKNPENRGFGSGNNFGAKGAKGKYLFLLNPDTVLLNNAIAKFYAFCESNEQVGIVGGNLYDANLQPAFSCWSFLPSLTAEIDFLCFFKLGKILGRVGSFNNTGIPQKVGYISGADLFIPKSIFVKAGGFDEDFFMYYEETELTFRVRQLGYDVMSLPNAKIIHLEGQSEPNDEKVAYRMRKSEKLYYTKTNQRYLIRLSYKVDTFFYTLVVIYNKLKRSPSKVEGYKRKLQLIRKIESL
ncbi:glycosyltransferase family 2 protein [Sphingobacterium sp. ML3W]|uniref:glycosyltransferase family 2 protein n=1 Tax=Sphingobacterium sp. ML3W TaxID=1538644 RepID=UPI00249CE6E6|nr:glycosyltransferase family 2 protein [Sphingobacterium sp. ML3W]WFA78215.1 glycosyltransferase family 2 protein [Sphingobacterium sp. ML3W]